ncbi:MAG TPA: hypothetical protein VHF01_15370 [Candidatus Acidoferrum sp.]|nr:hypothetical protein [Candidatus Acidoferrum sp.]
MRPSFSVRRALPFLICSVLFALSPAARGQAGTYTELNPKGQKAESIPISDRTVLFEVTMPSGKIAKLRIKEGGMAKIGDLEQGNAFALVPVIKDMQRQTASFTVFQLTQDKQGNESVQQLERVEVDAAAAIATNAEPKLRLRVISLEEPKSSIFGAQSDKLK